MVGIFLGHGLANACVSTSARNCNCLPVSLSMHLLTSDQSAPDDSTHCKKLFKINSTAINEILRILDSYLFARWISADRLHLTIDKFHLSIGFAFQIFQTARMQFVANAFLLPVMAFEKVAIGIFALWFTKWNEFHVDVVFNVVVGGRQLFCDKSTAVRTKWFIVDGDVQLKFRAKWFFVTNKYGMKHLTLVVDLLSHRTPRQLSKIELQPGISC